MSKGTKKRWVGRKGDQEENRIKILTFLENHPSFIKTQYGNFLSIDRKIQYYILNISLRKCVRKHPKDKWDREWTAQYKDIEINDGNFKPSKTTKSNNQFM